MLKTSIPDHLRTPEQLTLAHMQERHGFTDVQMARYLGVPYGTFRNWVRGTRTPSPTVMRLCTVLDTIATLAPGVHEMLTTTEEKKP